MPDLTTHGIAVFCVTARRKYHEKYHVQELLLIYTGIIASYQAFPVANASRQQIPHLQPSQFHANTFRNLRYIEAYINT